MRRLLRRGFYGGKTHQLQVGSLLATGALFVIFLGVYLFQFTRPGAFIAGEFFPAQPAGDTVLYQGELHGVPGVLIFEPQEDGGVFLLQFGGFSEKYGFAFGEEEGPHGRPLAITGGDGALVLECFYARAGPAPAGRDRAPATDDGLTITAETAGESQTTCSPPPLPAWPNWLPGTISTTGEAGSGFSLSAYWRGC